MSETLPLSAQILEAKNAEILLGLIEKVGVREFSAALLQLTDNDVATVTATMKGNTLFEDAVTTAHKFNESYSAAERPVRFADLQRLVVRQLRHMFEHENDDAMATPAEPEPAPVYEFAGAQEHTWLRDPLVVQLLNNYFETDDSSALDVLGDRLEELEQFDLVWAIRRGGMFQEEPLKPTVSRRIQRKGSPSAASSTADECTETLKSLRTQPNTVNTLDLSWDYTVDLNTPLEHVPTGIDTVNLSGHGGGHQRRFLEAGDHLPTGVRHVLLAGNALGRADLFSLGQVQHGLQESCKGRAGLDLSQNELGGSYAQPIFNTLDSLLPALPQSLLRLDLSKNPLLDPEHSGQLLGRIGNEVRAPHLLLDEISTRAPWRGRESKMRDQDFAAIRQYTHALHLSLRGNSICQGDPSLTRFNALLAALPPNLLVLDLRGNFVFEFVSGATPHQFLMALQHDVPPTLRRLILDPTTDANIAEVIAGNRRLRTLVGRRFFANFQETYDNAVKKET